MPTDPPITNQACDNTNRILQMTADDLPDSNLKIGRTGSDIGIISATPDPDGRPRSQSSPGIYAYTRRRASNIGELLVKLDDHHADEMPGENYRSHFNSTETFFSEAVLDSHHIYEDWKKFIGKRGWERVRWDWSEFQWNLLYSFLGPLSIPICWKREGSLGLQFRMFFYNGPGAWFPVVIQYTEWIVVTLTIALLWGGVLSSELFGETVLASCMFCLRHTVIAIKYGYMPIAVINEIRTNEQLANYEFIKAWQLLNGYAVSDELTFALQLAMVQRRSGIKFYRQTINFRDEACFDVPTSGWVVEDKPPRTNPICLENLARYVIYYSSKLYAKHYKNTSRFCSLMAILVACLLRAGSRHSADDDWRFYGRRTSDYVMLPLLVGIVLFQIFSLMHFLAVGVLDSWRRYFMMKFCSALIRQDQSPWTPGMMATNYKDFLLCKRSEVQYKYRGQSLEDITLETLDLSDPETIFLWTKLREVLLGFGLVFRRRLQAIQGMTMVAMIIVMVVMLWQILVEDSAEITWEVIAAAVVLIIAGFLPVHSSVTLASKVNYANYKQNLYLADLNLRLRTQLAQLDKSAIVYERLANARTVLCGALKMLSLSDDQLRFFGVKITPAVWQAILGVIGSTILVAVERFWRSQEQ